MATWYEMARSPEYSPALLSETLVGLESVLGIDEAMAGKTIIIGGFLNTDIIAAKSIYAEQLNVDTLSAVSADLGSITSGTITGATIRTDAGNDRIELSSNLLSAYSGGVRRVQLDYDSLDFYTPANRSVGELVALDSFLDYNTPSLQLRADNGAVVLRSYKTSSNYAYVNVYARHDEYDTDTPTIDIEARGAYGYGAIDVSSGTVELSYLNTSRGNRKAVMVTSDGFYIDGRTRSAGHISPQSNDAYYLGLAAYRWKTAYLVTNPNVSSDIRIKQNIQDLPDELIEELKEIKPKMFKQYDKWHFGYVAQDVERALYKYAVKKVGFENAREHVSEFEMLHKDESYLSLIYAEIAVLKEAEMQKRIDDLELRVQELEEQISN